jgi:hypothetical protein
MLIELFCLFAIYQAAYEHKFKPLAWMFGISGLIFLIGSFCTAMWFAN